MKFHLVEIKCRLIFLKIVGILICSIPNIFLQSQRKGWACWHYSHIAPRLINQRLPWANCIQPLYSRTKDKHMQHKSSNRITRRWRHIKVVLLVLVGIRESDVFLTVSDNLGCAYFVLLFAKIKSSLTVQPQSWAELCPLSQCEQAFTSKNFATERFTRIASIQSCLLETKSLIERW